MGELEQGSRRRRRWLFVAAAAGLAAALYIAFGYFGVHTLLFDEKVDEDGPVFDSGASASAPTTGAPDDPGDGAGSGAGEPAGDDQPIVTDLAAGQFSGVGRYAGTGTVTVLTDGTGQRFVRFEDDFATDNGPDLFVYLGTGSGDYGEPSQYVRLGTLKGNIGSQNYEIPTLHPVTGEPIDLDAFDHVAVWCQRFDATFAVARLA